MSSERIEPVRRRPRGTPPVTGAAPLLDATKRAAREDEPPRRRRPAPERPAPVVDADGHVDISV